MATLVGLAAWAALLWSCRGGSPGVPAADDYDSLFALRFEQPLDLMGPMQSLWYWRPLGRQAYFALFDSLFFTAPGVVAAAHAALLLLLYVLVFRTARRFLDPVSAAALAAFPLLAEPSRALFAWPTAAQPLLAMVFITLTLHEAAARRVGVAALAFAAALLCHEQAILALPALPALVAFVTVERGLRRRALLATAAVAIVYGALRVVAFEHGAGLPQAGSAATALAAAPGLFARSVASQLGLTPGAAGALALVPWAEAALLALAGFVFATRSEARRRLARLAPALGAGGAWFMLGILPLAFAAELWTPRHTSLPGLGLGLLACGVLACARPGLALGLTGVRLAALLLAPTVPPVVALAPPPEETAFSFLHVTRLQRTVDSARRAMRAEHATLAPTTAVRYWSLPRGTEIAFAGPRAVRVWYADSTLTWAFWDRFETGLRPVRGPVLAFNAGVPAPAVLMRPAAVAAYEKAFEEWQRDDRTAAEADLEHARRMQAPVVVNFTKEIVRLQARLAFARGGWGEADSLNRLDFALSGESASFYGMRAMLALQAGDRAGAAAAAERCLALSPDDFEGRQVAAALRGAPGDLSPARGAGEPGSLPGR
ncbi:MAG: hypothetical protein ABIP29_09520 [Candidatus Eisenbacteria bacterium]